MPISISVADYISLRSLCQLLPNRPHIATAHRWATRGIRGIALPTYLVGGSRMTTLADFDRWVTAVSASSSTTIQNNSTAATSSRRGAIARADRGLDRHGVKVDTKHP